ncbi:MAG: efflux transporter outer membrane subunit [Flavobacteriales bacterium]
MRTIIQSAGIAAILLMLLCQACMVGPRYARPNMPTVPSFNTGSAVITANDSVGALKWSDFYPDPVLRGLIDSALKRNYDLKMATSRIEIAAANYGIAISQLFPSFGYQLSGNQSASASGSSSLYTLGAGMSWEIDIWGKIRHSRNAALNDLLASEEGRAAVQVALISNVADAYYKLRDFDNRLAISKATYETRLQNYQVLEERFKQGYISEWDLLQSKQLVESAVSSINAYTRAVAITDNALSYLLANPPGKVGRGLANAEQPAQPVIPAGLPSALLSQRPDVRQAEYNYKREVEKIGVAEALRYPSLSLTAGGGMASSELSELLSSDALISSLTQNLLGPIFEFGRNKRRVTAQMKSAEVAAYHYQQVYLRALQEVENALVSIETIQQELAARKRQEATAREALTLSQARYNDGYTSYLELMDVQRSLFEIELLVSNLQQQYLNAYVDLYRALGGGK